MCCRATNSKWKKNTYNVLIVSVPCRTAVQWGFCIPAVSVCKNKIKIKICCAFAWYSMKFLNTNGLLISNFVLSRSSFNKTSVIFFPFKLLTSFLLEETIRGTIPLPVPLCLSVMFQCRVPSGPFNHSLVVTKPFFHQTPIVPVEILWHGLKKKSIFSWGNNSNRTVFTVCQDLIQSHILLEEILRNQLGVR